MSPSCCVPPFTSSPLLFSQGIDRSSTTSLAGLVKLFQESAEQVGLEFVFSGYSVERLLEFVRLCNLECESKCVISLLPTIFHLTLSLAPVPSRRCSTA